MYNTCRNVLDIQFLNATLPQLRGTPMSDAPQSNADKAKQGASEDAFPLNELVRCYTTQLDGVHKMWTYLMLMTAAAFTLAWTPQTTTSGFIVIVAIVYLIYAFFNAGEIHKQQETLKKLGDKIKHLP